MKKNSRTRACAAIAASGAAWLAAGAIGAAYASPARAVDTPPTTLLAAGPVVILPPETEPASVNRKAEIEQAVQAWKLSWELGEADTYLRFYDPGFKGDAPSRQQWERQRRARLARKDIGVRFDQLRTRMLGENEAEVQFVQHYASGRHRDVGDKRLHLKRVNGAWRITQESWKARR
jgi:hypothetical protein